MSESPTFGPLPEHVQKTIDDVQERIRQQEREILENKRVVNSLLAVYQLPPVFNELAIKPETVTGPLRGDEYFGQPLQSVVREILVRRKSTNMGPASVSEIYEAMLAGGYEFEAKDADNAKRGLRISLTKSSATFTKLPQGKYGLREWYPTVKDPKARPAQKERVEEMLEDVPDEFDFQAKETAQAET